MKILKWVGILLGVMLVLIGLVLAVGYSLPVGHEATVSVDLPANPSVVWRLIRDLEGTAEWRPGVTRVVRIKGTGGETWEETSQYGILRYRIEAEEPPVRLVLRIVDNPDFGGTWTYELAPAAGGTRLSITENGEIYNPLFRLVSRFVMGYEHTMSEYAEAILNRLS